ncbi:MAG TPA: NAD(P)/FAD-dependent oxidoreductase [Candidatus Binatia bacterium]|nr:NAD(P)/FAD-dependent oxidoreductase [Candidatus Binatia bacterium]
MAQRDLLSAREANIHRVVIIGGGFGGLYATQCLKHEPVATTLIDRRNFHLFQPLLYQVATGWLSPANIAATLRATLKRHRNTRVLLDEATGVDVDSRRVLLNSGSIDYDTLIVATGSRHHYFGNDHWEALAPGLKTVEDATEIRRRIFSAFEAAERGADQKQLQALLTFVIVGGGPTGVELAGALGEIANDTLKNDFRDIDPAKARILLVEAGERILPTYPSDLSHQGEISLRKLGVTVQTQTFVTDIQPTVVTVKRGGTVETIPCRTVIWAAGVQASSLGKAVAQATGAQLDRSGRIMVEPDLTVPDHPEIFVIGDLANYSHQTGNPLPGTAPVAIQQGRYVAQLIRSRLAGKPPPSFHYRDHGNMAIIGRASAVADLGKLKFSGFLAWLAWLFVHLMNLVEFENKVLVLIQWGWYYFSRNRAARLITGDTATDPKDPCP